jgi:hypothetical protein
MSLQWIAYLVYPTACVRSSILFTATGRPLEGWAMSSMRVRRISNSSLLKPAGVTTPSSLLLPPSCPRFVPAAAPRENTPRADPESPSPGASSRKRSHKAYRPMISCTIVATRVWETFKPASQSMKSCGGRDWRAERRVDEPVPCTAARVLGWSMSVR